MSAHIATGPAGFVFVTQWQNEHTGAPYPLELAAADVTRRAAANAGSYFAWAQTAMTVTQAADRDLQRRGMAGPERQERAAAVGNAYIAAGPTRQALYRCRARLQTMRCELRASLGL